MSSEFYPPSLSRNLIRTGAAGYRENMALGILNRAEVAAAGRPGQSFEASGSFAAFPDFSHGPNALRSRSPGPTQGQSRHALAASLDKHSGIELPPI